MKHVIVFHDWFGDRIIGPFDSASEAIAYAVNTFGWAHDQYRKVWQVRPMEEAQ